jgi:hypothetical protein
MKIKLRAPAYATLLRPRLRRSRSFGRQAKLKAQRIKKTYQGIRISVECVSGYQSPDPDIEKYI